MQSLKTVSPRPPFWFQLSILEGNLIQLAGILLGIGILYLDAHSQAPGIVRVILMVVGWFFLYICTHASGHWLVGRLAGIQFRGYGVRGTDHPDAYPAGVRQAMSAMPTFTVMTQKTSMQTASPLAKAMMFAAGETSTSIFSIWAGAYAWSHGVPGGAVFFWILLVFTVLSIITTALIPRGDYAKAWAALKPGTSRPT